MLLRFWALRCACGSGRLRRSSRRNAVENALGLLMLPWRCLDCSRRCFRASWLAQQPLPSAQPPKPLLKDVIDKALDRTARAFDKGTGDTDLD